MNRFLLVSACGDGFMSRHLFGTGREEFNTEGAAPPVPGASDGEVSLDSRGAGRGCQGACEDHADGAGREYSFSEVFIVQSPSSGMLA